MPVDDEAGGFSIFTAVYISRQHIWRLHLLYLLEVLDKNVLITLHFVMLLQIKNVCTE